MNRIVWAFQAFFSLLFSGKLSDDLVKELGLAPITANKSGKTTASTKGATATNPTAAAPKPTPPPQVHATDGALQMLGILQRDGRILDFFLEDVTPYSDEQVGSAARGVHTQVREALGRYFEFKPVIDGVEGSYTNAPSKDPALVKYIGNVPATPPTGGVLRHRGWQVTEIKFPAVPNNQNLRVIAPAELEVE